jgi:hypothetical protein
MTLGSITWPVIPCAPHLFVLQRLRDDGAAAVALQAI